MKKTSLNKRRKVNLATTTSITTTYQGESAGKYVSAMLLSANTIENGGVEVMPNIKFRATMKKGLLDDIVKNAECEFTPTSELTLTERIIEPKELAVNLTLCRKDFRSDWDAISMGYSVYDNLPPTFEEWMIAYVLGKVAQRNEISLWQGDGAVSGQYKGLTSHMADGIASGDIPAGNVVGTPVTIDANNVIGELGRVADAISNANYGSEGLSIYVPQNVMRAYVRALGGFGAQGLGASGTDAKGTQWYNNQALTFDGIPLFMANGMASNTMVATTKDNLYFGTGILNDSNEVRLIDTSETLGDQNIRIVCRFTAGCNYAVGDDVVTYGI
tara:strand:+ start:662 stop:1651 length:990 start_codon:yes stop_codon:yes gene_type:complete